MHSKYDSSEASRVTSVATSTGAVPAKRRGLAIDRVDGGRRGSTMVEVMIAAVILIIALIGTSTLFVSGRKHLISQQFYRAAAHLSSQKLEECKAVGYDNLDEGEHEENLSFNGVIYHRRTLTEVTAEPSAEIPKPCKRVTVTLRWSIVNDQHETRFVTYIGP